MGYELLVKEEENVQIKENIKKFLEEDTAALCFIAPYIPEKISPTKYIPASIDIIEELMIEDVIDSLKNKNIKKILLLVNSPGGGVSSSYKIAYALRKNFEEITVFVPHIAASGGTLIALSGNKIIMGDMSHLTPIDVQLNRNGKTCSVNAMIRSFHNLRNLLKKQDEEDIEYPIKALANKLDPVELQEWMDKSELMEQHAKEVMEHQFSPLKEKAESIINWLTTGCPTHSYSIMFENAQEHLGKEIVIHCTDTNYKKIWESIRNWLREYIMKESSQHFITYVLPEIKKPKEENKDLNKTNNLSLNGK